jgi:hypothetical protein
VPQAQLGWPNIPGVTYTGLVTVRNLFDFGPQFHNGILSVNPPAVTGKVYPSFVSRVNQDGNEIAGIQLPPVAAPVATTTGWALRAPAFGGPDGRTCYVTEAERGNIAVFRADAPGRSWQLYQRRRSR